MVTRICHTKYVEYGEAHTNQEIFHNTAKQNNRDVFKTKPNVTISTKKEGFEIIRR
jgi:hypothetical protein